MQTQQNGFHFQIKFSMKHTLFICALLFSFSGKIHAQTEPSFKDIQAQMEQMQQQMMRMFDLDSSQVMLQMPSDMPFGGMIDTSFFFQSDSLFSGEGFGRMFQMPFDGDGMMDMSEIMKSFGDIMQHFGDIEGMDGFSTMPPSDDGAIAEDEDYILPEDRLREEENSTPNKKTKKKRKTVKM